MLAVRREHVAYIKSVPSHSREQCASEPRDSQAAAGMVLRSLAVRMLMMQHKRALEARTLRHIPHNPSLRPPHVAAAVIGGSMCVHEASRAASGCQLPRRVPVPAVVVPPRRSQVLSVVSARPAYTGQTLQAATRLNEGQPPRVGMPLASGQFRSAPY